MREGWLSLVFCLALTLGLTSAIAQGTQLWWPLEIVVEGKAVKVNAPQLQSLTETALKGRSRVSVEIVKGGDPSVGSAWFTASVTTDKSARLLRVIGLRVDRTQVPELSSSDARAIATVIESRVRAAQIVLPLDHVLASLPASAKANTGGAKQDKNSVKQDKDATSKTLENPGTER